MANTYLCPACGATNSAQATHCKGCGQAVPPGGGVRETLFELDQPATSKWQWGMVFGGAAIILALQAVVGLLLVPGVLWGALAPAVLTALVLGVSVLVYFVAGLLLGRLSAGYTVKEAGVGGFLAAAINWPLEAYLFQNTILGLGVLAAIALGLGIVAALGGSAGETFQQWSEKRQRAEVRAKQGKA